MGVAARYTPLSGPKSELGQKRPWCHVGSDVWFARKQTSIDGRQDAMPMIAVIRVTAFMEYRQAGSLRLDVGRPDHLAPFFSFVRDELSEIGRRARHPRDSEIVEPRLDLRIVERTLDFAVEPADKLRGCPPGGAKADPSDCFVAGHGFTNGRDFRQYLQSCRGGHA